MATYYERSMKWIDAMFKRHFANPKNSLEDIFNTIERNRPREVRDSMTAGYRQFNRAEWLKQMRRNRKLWTNTMKSKKTTILDELLLAVRGSSECATSLQKLNEQLRDNLYDLQAHLVNLLGYPQLFEAPEAEKLLRRIERLIELRNMMELASFGVSVNRDMEAIWNRIPK